MKEVYDNMTEGLTCLQAIARLYKTEDLREYVLAAQNATPKGKGIQKLLYKLDQWQKK